MVQAYSMGTAPRMGKSASMGNLNPGPGSYRERLHQVKKKAPGWKLGTMKRPGLHNSGKGPGPGAYNADDKKHGPKYVMGMKTKVDFSYLKATPGPGNYLSTTDLLGEKSKGYSFGGKNQFSKTGKQFPGPGQYDIKSTISLKERGSSFGRERRGKGDSKKNPGPGQYTVATSYTQKAAPKFGFGSQMKGTNMASRAATPGPGAYNQKVHGRNAPRGVLLPRRPDSAPARGRGTPGPGQYNDVLTHKKAAPKYGMGTGPARAGTSKDKLKSPAPNAYNQSVNTTLLKSPGWKIGSDKRRPLSARNANPGPGNYTIASGKSGPAFGMRGRNYQMKGNMTPGPGQYNPKAQTIQHKDAMCRIGTESRNGADMSTKKFVPGPGQYDGAKEKVCKAAPKIGFGTGKRGAGQKSSTPGPGNYHIPCKVVDVPRYLNTKQPEEFRFI